MLPFSIYTQAFRVPFLGSIVYSTTLYPLSYCHTLCVRWMVRQGKFKISHISLPSPNSSSLCLPPPIFFFFFLSYYSVSHFCLLKVHQARCCYSDTVPLWLWECRWFQNSLRHCLNYCICGWFGNVLIPCSLFQGPQEYLVGIRSSFLYYSISVLF